MTSESDLFYEEKLHAQRRAADLFARRTATYDSRCYDLAEVFLEGESFATKANCDELASEIQQCIEGFILVKQAEVLESEHQKQVDYALEDKRDAGR